MNEDKLKTYTVRTLHEGDNTFIVPVVVRAESHFDAAEKRLRLQCESSRAETNAILVEYDWGGDPHLFKVEHQPTVAPA
jgi:hypothetical protein